jgi:predicted RNase H-like HicB family nuclease
MITYTAGYKIDSDGVHAEVFDFPGVITCGSELNEAREMLADALVGMAEINLKWGEPLPKPNPTAVQADFDVIEPIRLVLSTNAGPVDSGAAA